MKSPDEILNLFKEALSKTKLPSGQALKNVCGASAELKTTRRFFQNTWNLNSLQNFFPDIQSLCHSLSEALNSQVSCNVYMTPPNSGGLPLHSDSEDIVIYQTEGEQHWLELSFKAGDLFFIKAGRPHLASTHKTDSVHYSFVIHSQSPS